MTEMLESFGFQIPNMRAFRDKNLSDFIGDVAYVGDGRAVNPFGKATNVLRSHSEKKLEVFAAVKRQHQRIKRASPAQPGHIRIDWNSSGFEPCAYAALFANVREVGRKPVAQINHGSCQPVFPKEYTPACAWHRFCMSAN